MTKFDYEVEKIEERRRAERLERLNGELLKSLRRKTENEVFVDLLGALFSRSYVQTLDFSGEKV
jgi:hypothetical protein